MSNVLGPLASAPGLSAEGCRARQRRLRERLTAAGLEAALCRDPGHVHYLSGYWCRSVFSPMLLVLRDGPAVLSAPVLVDDGHAADEVVVYESNKIATLVDDQPGAALAALAPRLAGLSRIGSDQAVWPALLEGVELTDLRPVLLHLRRGKDADEVALLRRAYDAAQAAYAYAAAALKPGVTEVEIFAGMQAAAVAHAGEGIGEFGNDFQIGSLGSAPRRRAAREGEIAIFDLGVVLRGYSSDMCRSFVVGRRPSPQQADAHARLLDFFSYAESVIRPGASCRELYGEARRRLDGYRGWSFTHHLGHGVGLHAHEAPRLNPHWDDTFQVGDVVAVEPGLYGPDLSAGLRIEQAYHIGEAGLMRMTDFPVALAL